MKTKPKLTPEQKEAQSILKDIEKEDSKLPDKGKNILDWNMKELRAYVLKETSKMNTTDKLKWARALDKRLKDEKAKRKAMEVKK